MQLQRGSEQFCHHIMNLETPHSKVFASLIMSLSSNRPSGSVVGLSENPLFQQSYSSISQLVSTLSADKSSHNAVQKSLQELYISYYGHQEASVFQTDTSPLEKPHSYKMSERQYINGNYPAVFGDGKATKSAIAFKTGFLFLIAEPITDRIIANS